HQPTAAPDRSIARTNLPLHPQHSIHPGPCRPNSLFTLLPALPHRPRSRLCLPLERLPPRLALSSNQKDGILLFQVLQVLQIIKEKVEKDNTACTNTSATTKEADRQREDPGAEGPE